MINAEFDERGTSLIQEMVALAMAQSTEPRVRAQLLLGMARFLFPTLTAIAVKTSDAPQTSFVLDLGGGEVIEVKSAEIGSNSGSKAIDQD